jgi:hypothetical protein
VLQEGTHLKTLLTMAQERPFAADFVQIALRLLALPVSEAAVERMISLQRRVECRFACRINEESELKRLRLSQHRDVAVVLLAKVSNAFTE